MSKYRILSLDGGGIRGLLTTMLLEHLCKQPGLEHVFDDTYLIAGNSSGALIALAMAHGLAQPTTALTLGRLRSVFENGPQIFGSPVPFPVGFWLWTKFGEKARANGLKQLLGEHTRLRDLQRHVLISSFQLDNQATGNEAHRRVWLPQENAGLPRHVQELKDARTWRPKLFHNFPPDSDCEMEAWKVALYSTAAPAYFPTADGFIDGGVYANNPAMCALAQLFDNRYAPTRKPPLNDVLLLSVGAGQNLKFIEGRTHHWGVLRWASNYVWLTVDGTVSVADYQCRQMLTDSNYWRLAPNVPAGEVIQLDDLDKDKIDRLTEITEKFVAGCQFRDCVAWLKSNWMPDLNISTFNTRGARLMATTSKHIGTATELTCLMKIRSGFIPALDTMSYATRLRVVFKVLQALRVASREQKTLKPVLDIVEAARTVHAFSWAIVNEGQLLLTVSFDRPWEPYIRVIWKDLGPLLDLFLCNCEDFVPSTESFDRFADFVRKHQVDTGFYYPASSLTVEDERYLVELEQKQRDGAPDFPKLAAGLVARGPEELAREAVILDPVEANKQRLAVLKALYGLRNVFPQDSDDHVYLHRAARVLLRRTPPNPPLTSPEVDWFNDVSLSGSTPPSVPDRKIDISQVQGGILKPYRRVSHGCLLLASVDPVARIERPEDARQFINELLQGPFTVARASDQDVNEQEDDRASKTAREGESRCYLNVAFTFNGLRQLGVFESVLSRLPKEFSEGMEARAGLLGDVQQNHPDKWVLPERNVLIKQTNHGIEVEFVGSLATPPATDAEYPPVRVSSIDIVLILHQTRAWNKSHEWRPAHHPLYERVASLCEQAWKKGVHVLSVQPLRRFTFEKGLSRDHFGFLDGISQPQAVDSPDASKRDEVKAGELLVGFQNDRGDCPFPENSGDLRTLGRDSIIDSGSFLVIRKLEQHVETFQAAIARAVSLNPGLTVDELRAKMLGRWDDGAPLLEPGARQGTTGPSNDFDFGNDAGSVCPFHAHIRRANPRLKSTPGSDVAPHIPRIARRGLAYGPERGQSEPTSERGMMFMAYNASLAEQFEIIQRWMSGGNTPATDGGVAVFSGQPDPLLGLPGAHESPPFTPVGVQNQDCSAKRIFQFIDQSGTPRRVDLGQHPFVSLKWGLYLFAPSIAALNAIAERKGSDLTSVVDVIALGSRTIEKLETEEAWATLLEDVTLAPVRSAVFAAIRAATKGIRRTKYGVLVANTELVMEVLRNDKLFSVREYQNRFDRSVGKGYLGMDSGPEYEEASTGPNEALRLIREDRACNEAHRVTQEVFEEIIAQRPAHSQEIEVSLESVIDRVLARLANAWFDIPDGNLILIGRREQDSRPQCPFHLLAPSRYVFSSPNPRPKVISLGQEHGQRLLAQVRTFVDERRKEQRFSGSAGLRGPISNRLFEIIPDNDLLARTLLGLVFGFVPTVFGSALAVVKLWLDDETLWRLQQRLMDERAAALYDRASVLRKPLELAMQRKPVPALLHRIVVRDTTLGETELKEGERVVLCMSSATEEIVRQGGSNIYTVFGGDREAAATSRPTHACPGYEIAMGVLLGMLTAILEIGTMKPKPGLATVELTPRQARTNLRLAHAQSSQALPDENV
jgi:Dyp-type peroxidase family